MSIVLQFFQCVIRNGNLHRKKEAIKRLNNYLNDVNFIVFAVMFFNNLPILIIMWMMIHSLDYWRCLIIWENLEKCNWTFHTRTSSSGSWEKKWNICLTMSVAKEKRKFGEARETSNFWPDSFCVSRVLLNCHDDDDDDLFELRDYSSSWIVHW